MEKKNRPPHLRRPEDFQPSLTVTQEKTESTAQSTKSSTKLLDRRNVGNRLATCVLGRETLEHPDERAFEITLGRDEQDGTVAQLGPATQ